ncbi:unnamed protein product [Caenorhabditis auriculariae]|uniref:Major sperm protein n=1 Tax=Caenorhabditis auriculariae TaxID=2777116 RepID=A0A8S1GW18_9PELO|nr:unnamed protein product [Caenorhabditis auriculariae]
MTPPKRERSVEKVKDHYLKIEEKQLKKQFEKLAKSSKPLLETKSKILNFVGLVEDRNRCCVHVSLTNNSDQIIAYIVRCPESPCFFVKPKIGVVYPEATTTLYFTFRSKCHRVPDDYAWFYTVYQIEVPSTRLKWLKEDEFSSTHARSIWREHGRKPVDNLLFLAATFEEINDGEPHRECQRHFPIQPVMVNEEGNVLEEEEYDPDRHETTDDMPATAET